MGRGEYHRRNAKISTDDLLCVRLSDLKRENCLTPGQSYVWHWSRDGERVASVRVTIEYSFIQFVYSISDKTVNKIIPLTFTPCNFGGYRKWFVCDCGRRVATMYICGQEMACRHCFNAVYPSQREDAIDRQWRKIYKLQARLKDDWYRPKGMHIKTFNRITHEWIEANTKKDELFELECARRFSKIEFLEKEDHLTRSLNNIDKNLSR